MSSVEPRVHAAEALPEDDVEGSLRPRRLTDFIGQEALKDQLTVCRIPDVQVADGIHVHFESRARARVVASTNR